MSTQNKPMSKFEWLTRCQMQFAKSTLAFDYDWSVIAESCYDEMSEDFESDPEGCAREEMSCWD